MPSTILSGAATFVAKLAPHPSTQARWACTFGGAYTLKCGVEMVEREHAGGRGPPKKPFGALPDTMFTFSAVPDELKTHSRWELSALRFALAIYFNW